MFAKQWRDEMELNSEIAKRVLRLILKNVGVLAMLLAAHFAVVLLADWILAPSPSLLSVAFGAFVKYGDTLLAVGFIAVTLPLLWQFNTERRDF
jgi:hypothetical protein